MASTMQQMQPCLFSMELIVSLGGSDTEETRKMLEVLNGVMRIWGREVIQYMEAFLNLVKSKTDELARTLDMTATPTQQKGSRSVSVEVGSENGNKIKALESEKRELKEKLKEMEASLPEAQSLSLLVKSYNAKSINFENLRDESGRHSIWFNEQLHSLYAIKADLEATVGKKNKVIQELESKLSSESLQVSLFFSTIISLHILSEAVLNRTSFDRI